MKKLKSYLCLNCGKEFTSFKWKKKYCNNYCATKKRWSDYKNLGIPFREYGGCLVSTVSFKKINELQKTEFWRNARKVYLAKNPILICSHCGIIDEEIIDVCHIKGISEFSKETLMLEVNQISNLIALCKNCHWKFDKHLPGKKGNKKFVTTTV